jgi:hypothetical protein
MQLLYECVRCKRGFLGRYLLHSFGMRPIPQTSLNIKNFINSFMSKSEISLVVHCTQLGEELEPPYAFGDFHNTGHG